MNISDFIQRNGIRTADVIISKKIGWNVFDHTISYLGQDSVTWKHLFIANMTNGVRILNETEVLQLLSEYRPEKLRRFSGTEDARNLAVRRALSKLGENNYHLIFNNCEHLTNYIQTGKSFSRQSRNFGAGAGIFLLLLLIFAGNGK